MNKQDAISQLKTYFTNDLFEIKEQEQLLSDSWRKSRVDYAVYQRVKNTIHIHPDKDELIEGEETVLTPFCFIILTSDSVALRYSKQIAKRIISDSAFWFGIILDAEINVYTSFENPSFVYSWKKCSIENIASIIGEFQNRKLDEDSFRSALTATIEKLKLNTEREKLIIDAIHDNIDRFYFSQYGRTVSITLLNQFALISSILRKTGVTPSKRLCRYTSANSLHRIIDSRVESMCGLAVMNDKSEGFYLDKCISPSASYNIWTKPQYEVDEYNNAYITSLCDIGKSDDLTMWRLYGGEDGDGVCLEYDLDDDVIRQSTHLLLMPVQYGNYNNPIIQLFRLINKFPIILGFQFVLSFKNIFRYFVKPEGFKIEEEYRLLLKKDKSVAGMMKFPKWIFNNTYKIFHPIQELELPSSTEDQIKSPLILKKVILGPKCKEASVNKVQLRAWLNQLGLSHIVVEESKISFYR